MPILRLSFLQTDLIWQKPELNFSLLEEKLTPLAGKTDLVVLPEMFTTGFTDAPATLPQAASLDHTLSWMKRMAKKNRCALYGSSAFQATPQRWVNRAWFVTPNGLTQVYDKVHLFGLGHEKQDYSPGEHRVLVNYEGWRILLTVCYDLRFPSFCRNTHHYDLMVCVANWPKVRSDAWKTLLAARAIENQAYTLGVNRIGTDGKGILYSGDSRLVDYKGKVLLDGGNTESLLTTVIDTGSQRQFRQDYPFLSDADETILQGIKTIESQC